MVHRVVQQSRPLSTAAVAPREAAPVECGIGCLVATSESGECVITKVVNGGSAAASGQVAVGEIIVNIDGKPPFGMSAAEIRKALIGPPGSSITLILRHPYSSHSRTVELQRMPLEPISEWTKEVAGIGAVIAQDINSNIVVARLVYGGAAGTCKAADIFGEDRLHRGDIILAVNTRSVHQMSTEQVAPLLTGPVGSTVKLLIKVSARAAP